MDVVFAGDMATRFKSHAVDEEGSAKLAAIRELAMDFSISIGEFVPACRERSLALTKLEEVVFWANAGIARNRPKV